MIDYRIRSMSLLQLVSDVRADRLIPDAYFQRNLVWREIHKKDFIKTILMGLPFPQIFVSKGKIDVDRMLTTSCIVDGQQRTNAIMEFIDDGFDVEGEKFSGLTEDRKAEFFKYDIAVIELDLENTDPKVQEIFQRINRTSNSLTVIEKLASQYSTSEFMLTAKLLADDIVFPHEAQSEFQVDPNIPAEFYEWAKKIKVRKFPDLITKRSIFTSREISRKVHLMHVLNIISTFIGSFFNRNEKSNDYLDDYAMIFPDKDRVIAVLESTADTIVKLKLSARSYWLNKANIFSLTVAIAKHLDEGKGIEIGEFAERLKRFEKEIPEDYRLAATEGVNSTKARTLRHDYISKMIKIN